MKNGVMEEVEKVASSQLTRAQATAETIRQLIVLGDFKPGDRLVAQRLADQLGVSRTPIVDALSALHQEGLLNYEARCGYSVRPFDLKLLLDSFDVRMTLEGLACRLLAEQGLDKETSGTLVSNIDRSEEALFGSRWSYEEQDHWRHLNREFHDLLIRAADNPYLTAGVANTRLLPLIYDQSQRNVAQEEVQRQFDRSKSQQAFSDHVRILQAIETRQGWRAEAMMKEHVFANREATRRAIERTTGIPGKTFNRHCEDAGE